MDRRASPRVFWLMPSKRLPQPMLAVVLAWLLLLTAPPAWCAWSDDQPVQVRDDRGVQVRLARPARRIVSLLPSLTETVCALGACGRLVGTDRHSNFPQQVLTLPKLGGLDDASVERIVALRPDLVLLAMSSRVIERLEGLGISVVVLEPRSQRDVQRVLDLVARLVGSDDAADVWRGIQAKIEQARRQVAPAARGLPFYFEVGSGPYAASETAFVGEVMTTLGLRNIVPAGLGPYPLINPELVVGADPALILIAANQAAGLASRPGWDRVRALRDDRLCRFDAAQGDVLARAGPRIGEAALLLTRCINQALAAAPLTASTGAARP